MVNSNGQLIDLGPLGGRQNWFVEGMGWADNVELNVCRGVAASTSPCPLTAASCALVRNGTTLDAVVLGAPASPQIDSNGNVSGTLFFVRYSLSPSAAYPSCSMLHSFPLTSRSP